MNRDGAEVPEVFIFKFYLKFLIKTHWGCLWIYNRSIVSFGDGYLNINWVGLVGEVLGCFYLNIIDLVGKVWRVCYHHMVVLVLALSESFPLIVFRKDLSVRSVLFSKRIRKMNLNFKLIRFQNECGKHCSATRLFGLNKHLCIA